MNNPVIDGFLEGFRPRPRITLSQWAEQEMVLPPERAANPGPYRIGDAEYQRMWMDACTDPDCSSVVVITSSQVGKTTVQQAAQGYYAEREPSPQISVWPTDKVANEYYDEVFSRFVEANPALRRVMGDGTAYPGGGIVFEGSGNPRGLASRPIRILTGDEVDRWALSAGKEGAPVDIVRKRMTTYKNSKEILVSTPLNLSNSVITKLFQETNQHYYHVVCHECSKSQVLQWENVRYTKGKEQDAMYSCEECGVLWSEIRKRQLVRDAPKMGGGWKILKPGPYKCFHTDFVPPRDKWGFWINEIYSPFSSMAIMAQTHSRIRGNVGDEQVFVNTSLGLPWAGDKASVADAELLRQRREDYRVDWMPREAVVLTAAVDVQLDRIVVMITAWGAEDESWVLKYQAIQIDPSSNQAWSTLAEELQRVYPHPAGVSFPIAVVAIDSGYMTQQVYRFSALHQKQGKSWFAIKGQPGQGRALWQISETVRRKGTKLWLIGTDTGKDTIYSRYAITERGPGYIHLNASISDAVIDEMTVEHAETKANDKGYPVRAWIKPPGRPNEGLDLMVYNLAARSSITPDIAARLRALYGPAEAALPTLEELGQQFKEVGNAR